MGNGFYQYLSIEKCYPIHAYYGHARSRISNFTQQGMEKLNDQTTIDFAKSTNHNYHNLDALKQLMDKRNRIEQRYKSKKLVLYVKPKGTIEKNIIIFQ